MEVHEANKNPEQLQLSFPQRYWLLICIFLAIFSPLMVQWMSAAAHHHNYKEVSARSSVNGGTGGSTPSGGAVAPGDTSRPGSVNAMTPSVHTSTADSTAK